MSVDLNTTSMGICDEQDPTRDCNSFHITTTPGATIKICICFLRPDLTAIRLSDLVAFGPLLVEGVGIDKALPLVSNQMVQFNMENYILVLRLSVPTQEVHFPYSCILRLETLVRVIPIYLHESYSSQYPNSRISSRSRSPLLLLPPASLSLSPTPFSLPQPSSPSSAAPPPKSHSRKTNTKKTSKRKNQIPSSASSNIDNTTNTIIPTTRPYQCRLCGAVNKKRHICTKCKECEQDLTTPGHRRCHICSKCLVNMTTHICKKKKKPQRRSSTEAS